MSPTPSLRFPRVPFAAAVLVAMTLSAATSSAEPAQDADATDRAQADASAYVGDPYPLATCPVSGEPLGDNPVPHVHDGRHLLFATADHVEAFKADPGKYLADVDAKLIETQREHYPLDTCPVSGQALGSMGEPVEMVVGNRLVKLCCGGCVGKAEADPEAVIAKLDAAVIAQQADGYAATTCPVSGQNLDAMGGPLNYVVANRLVKLCCEGCVPAVEAYPVRVLVEIDAGHDD